ncbi:Uncharacterised protein [Mycobacteroides abscessus subsp. massiliense]|nr:Uncharacterised protein [Mycobacteroides abscessus subsp. massiliense]
MNVTDVGIDRVADGVHQTMRQPQCVPLGKALPRAELVVQRLTTDPCAARDVGHRDRRPVPLAQQIAQGVEDRFPKQRPRSLGIRHSVR